VELGVTTGFDVNGLLVQGGGEICASLDVPGAAFNVADPNAGTMRDVLPEVCLESGIALIGAIPNGDAIIPDGYTQLFVLTQGPGLVIVDAGANPVFEVTQAGTYTIHSLVYDPNTLDLSIVQFGVTTGFDVNGLLVQGGGAICASLDVPGAEIVVLACDDECLADAGTISNGGLFVCRQGGTAQLEGFPNGNAVVPAGYETLYVLTRGGGLIIENVSATPDFTVTQLGIFRIHTLVYDPATLDLSIVQLGVTTGFDVNGLLIQGGGEICASLDVTGAIYVVVGPFLCNILNNFFGLGITSGPDAIALGDGLYIDAEMLRAIEDDMPLSVVNAWPNPAIDILNLDVQVYVDTRMEMTILDMTGREVSARRALSFGTGRNLAQIDVAGLKPGQYILRIDTGDRVVTQRFMKMD
jgi:hypothetical protein